MRASTKLLLLMGRWNPYRAPGIVARYNVNDLTSLIYDGSDRIGLYSDLSGNSAVNCLVTNGTSGNNATAADSPELDISSLDYITRIAPVDWTPGAANQVIAGKVTSFSPTGMSWYLQLNQTTGFLTLVHADGTNTFIDPSTAAPSIADMAAIWVRVTLEPNVAGSRRTIFYTAPDSPSIPTSWSQLGNPVTGAASLGLHNSSSALSFGGVTGFSVFAGLTFFATMSAFGSAPVITADFTTAAKLATSFTESSVNAATVTINTTGDLGARICGARDIVMMTALKKLVLSNVAGFWQALANGTSQYSASASFPLAQPYAVDVVLTQQTWTINDVLIDGRGADTGELFQDTTTPRLSMYAGNVGPTTTQAAVARKVAITMIFDGASSYIIVNGNTPISGNAGALTPNGITLAAVASGSSNGNVSFNEIIVREGPTVRNLALATKINRALMRKNAVI